MKYAILLAIFLGGCACRAPKVVPDPPTHVYIPRCIDTKSTGEECDPKDMVSYILCACTGDV